VTHLPLSVLQTGVHPITQPTGPWPATDPGQQNGPETLCLRAFALVIIVEPGAAPGLNPDAIVDMGKMGMGGDMGGMSGG